MSVHGRANAESKFTLPVGWQFVRSAASQQPLCASPRPGDFFIDPLTGEILQMGVDAAKGRSTGWAWYCPAYLVERAT